MHGFPRLSAVGEKHTDPDLSCAASPVLQTCQSLGGRGPLLFGKRIRMRDIEKLIHIEEPRIGFLAEALFQL